MGDAANDITDGRLAAKPFVAGTILLLPQLPEEAEAAYDAIT